MEDGGSALLRDRRGTRATPQGLEALENTMKLVKSLLGSTAGLCAVAGAHAADLPVKKAAPVEYVRICTAYGAGFFYIPGTDTCLRVGGRARGEYSYGQQRSRGVYNPTTFAPGSNSNADVSGFRGLGRLNLDARTQTAYGTLRAFVRFEIANVTGANTLRSGTTERQGNAFPGTGVDTFGRAQTFVNVDKAFVQFAGITAGRASSFFDFYAHDLEIIGFTTGSDVPSTNLFAYTATLGGGLSATISIEDPTARRNPVFNQGGVFGLSSGLLGVVPASGQASTGANVFVGNPPGVAPVGVVFDPVTGIPTIARFLDIAQRNGVPDFVGALRLDQSWGSVQLSGASHEIQVGQFDPNTVASGNFSQVAGQTVVNFPGAFLTPFGANTAGAGFGSPLAIAPTGGAGTAALLTASTTGTNAVTNLNNQLNINAANLALANAAPGRRPSNEYGWAIQGGLKLNLPFIAQGDLLYLQAAYSEGALNYTRAQAAISSEVNSSNFNNRFTVNINDAAVDAFGRLRLTKSWSVVGALQHYWTPQLRQAVFGSYSKVDYDSILRTPFGPAGVLPIATANGVTNFGNLVNQALNPTLRDYNVAVVGSHTTWSPVKDLDIGVETVYQRIETENGRVVDTNKNLPIGAINNVTGAIVPLGSPQSTVIFKSAKVDDQFLARVRVQRDF